MRNHPVHWCDGLFLVPQHFQAADRHWQELLQTSEYLDQEYYYGLKRFDLNREGLANSHFEIDAILARTREGTIVMLDRGEVPDRTAIRTALDEAESLHAPLKAELEKSFSESLGETAVIRAYVGIPKLKWGSVNVARGEQPGLFRYREVATADQDESSGGNDQEIGHKVLQTQIVLSTEDLSNYELLPIAQLKRGPDGPELDPQYIPPLLTVDAWEYLHHDILRHLYERLGSEIEKLSEHVKVRGITWSSQDPAENERLVMLSIINEAYTILGSLVYSRGVHPFTAYRELCRIVGRLCILDESRRPPEDLPNYDHDNLGPVFLWFRDWIINVLTTGPPPDRVEQEWFYGEGLGMAVTIKNRWLNPQWDWYVGVHHAGLTKQECQKLLKPDHLHWKLASQRQVEYIFSNSLPGLLLQPMEQTPPGTPARHDWTYYEVTRSPRQVWEDVGATCTLGMRYREELIENRDQLSGQRQMIVNLGSGRLVELEFALFASPRRA